MKQKKSLRNVKKNNEKEFKVTDKKLLRALTVQFWIQSNPVKGAALLAAIPLATGAAVSTAPIAGVIGYALTIGSVTISVTEIIAIGFIIIGLTAVLKGQKIKKIDSKNGIIEFF